MSRLYWSNLPDAKRPRGGTRGLWSSLTTADLPIPEYPETSTNSGLPPATTRSNAVSKVSISRARPYNFSGISRRSGASCWPGEKSAMHPCPSHSAWEITLHAGRSLVAFLGGFGEQFHHDRRDTVGHTLHSFVRRQRMPCDVTMYPFKRIGSCERQVTGQHLVKRDAEGIEVASRVDRAIHSPGLFRSHVRKCSGDELGRFGGLMLAPKAGGDPKAHEPDLTRRGINQNIGRLHVLVNQLPFVQPAECRCETDRAG